VALEVCDVISILVSSCLIYNQHFLFSSVIEYKLIDFAIELGDKLHLMIIVTRVSCYFKHHDDQLFMFNIIIFDLDWDMAHDKNI
jgi:hypothetical protein